MSRPGQVARWRDAARERAERLTEATGLGEAAALEARVDSLEVAVAEDAALAVPLDALVERLEHDVAEVLARRGAPGMGA